MTYVADTLKYALRICTVAMALLLIGVGPFAPLLTSASQLQGRTLKLSNNIPGQTSNYEISMDIATAGTLGSIEVKFCSNLALLYYPCTPPTGFDVSVASISAQSGISGFTIDPSTTANILILSRIPSAVPTGTTSITLSGVKNQAAAGSSFARYYTYAANDASGPVIDDGAVAYSLNDDFGVSAEVPPYLTFCVATTVTSTDCTATEGDFVQLGQLTTARASAGTSQMALATNAESGYTIRILGQSMTSGNNVIPPLTTNTSSAPGTNQFGINLAANSDPSSGSGATGPGTGSATPNYGQSNSFRFVGGEIVASGTSVEDYRKYTVTYLVNINRSQPPGVYASSFSYIALGNF